MQVESYETDAAVVRLTGTEVLALANICNNTAQGLFERPERDMARRLQADFLDVLHTLRPSLQGGS
jgi:hypothetical protein